MGLDLGGIESRRPVGPKAAQLARPAGSRLTGVGILFLSLSVKQTLANNRAGMQKCLVGNANFYRVLPIAFEFFLHKKLLQATHYE